MSTKLGSKLDPLRPVPRRVRVSADGRTGTVSMVYYDRLHTGDSYDLLQVALDSGGGGCGPAECFESIDDEEEP